MLRFDPVRKTYSADLKHRTFGRVHLACATKVHAVAMRRHSALEDLLNTGEPVRDLVVALRARKLTIQAVEECVRAKLPFDTLRTSTWPALGAAVKEYTDAIATRDGGSEKTLANASSALAHAVTFFGAQRALDSITHEDVAAFKLSLATTLAPNTVGLYLTRFGALYTFLQRRETRRAAHHKRVPSRLLSPLDRDEHVSPFEHTRVRFLSDAEASDVLHASPVSLAPAVALGLLAGLRGGEICMLRRQSDVDLGAGVLRIQKRPGWQPKYGKNRDVPISSALRPYLETAMAFRPETPYLFASPTDAKAPIIIEKLRRDFYRVVTDAGLETGRDEAEGITLHTLRHTFASWLVMAGADLLTISRLMGHSGIKQVEQTYSHLSPEHKRATVELLATRWLTGPQDTTGDTTNATNEG